MTLNAADFYPYEYLLRIRVVECSNCRKQHSHSELMLVRVHAALGAGSAARQLTPVEEITGDLPISTTLLPIKKIGVCHLCVGSHPQADSLHRPAVNEARWAEALRRDATEHRRQAGALRRPAEPARPIFPADLSDIPL